MKHRLMEDYAAHDARAYLAPYGDTVTVPYGDPLQWVPPYTWHHVEEAAITVFVFRVRSDR